jgi:cytochrome c oxidase assembly factor CtaG
MTTMQVLLTTWDWEPTVLFGCADLLVAYWLFARPLTGRAWLFGSGVLVLTLALVSPLDTLGDTYLFSVHMAQHLLLILVVPPMLLLGVPPPTWARLLRWGPARRAERRLARPPQSWVLGMVTLWLWHAPVLYDLAVAKEGIHVVQHLSFLVTATIFWWPVLTPLARRRLALPSAMAYLISAAFASSILGVIITFAATGLYPAYQHPIDSRHILPLIRGQWGISYALDQQLGGMLMWATGGPIYLLTCLWSLARWLQEPEEANRLPPVSEMITVR